jgi:hypothetical protein
MDPASIVAIIGAVGGIIFQIVTFIKEIKNEIEPNKSIKLKKV